MNLGEWIGAILGGVTLLALLISGWLDGRQIKQALLGFEGKGGMMADVQDLRQDVTALRQQLAHMDREIRTEIARSRHDLRDEFTAKLTQAEGRLDERIDELDGRLRNVEISNAARPPP